MWFTLVHRFAETTSVQLAASMYETPSPDVAAAEPTLGRAAGRRARGSLSFSQAVITGPPTVVNTLAAERIPAECGRLTQDNGPAGRIQPLPAPPVGDRTWAYRIVDAEGSVWQWVQAAFPTRSPARAVT